MRKAEISEMSQLTILQLVIAFSLAGSDDIETHIRGMGWYRAVQLVKSRIPASRTAFDFVKNVLYRMVGLKFFIYVSVTFSI